jgi:16S rRNA processing protein RimM
MSTHVEDELIVVAQIAGAHGVKGDVKIRSFTEYPEDCFAYGPLRDETGTIIITPKKVTPAKDSFIVWPEENLQREEWIEKKGDLLHVWRSELPDTDDDEFYFSDLVGCRVEHVDGRILGKVLQVVNYGADDLLEMKSPAGEVYFLPFTQKDIPDVNLADGMLKCASAEELLPESISIASEDTEASD